MTRPHGELQEFGPAVPPAPVVPLPGYSGALVQVLAVAGYGVWSLLGGALALGVYHGRGEALVPLALGTLFVSVGLAGAWLGLPGASSWHGWHPARGARPTAAALFALAAYLPMLAVAGLVRGDNAFWVTRVAGAVLLAYSAANVAYAAHAFRRSLPGSERHCPPQLPLARLVAAGYTGGLWFWLCLSNQTDAALHASTRPWIMVLLALALAQGVFEGLRWQLALATAGAARTPGPRGRAARFVGALFSYAIPSVALLAVDLADSGAVLVAAAALSGLTGRTIEQRAYQGVLAQVCRPNPT